MWLVFTLLAGLLYTGEGLMARHVLRSNQDAWAFSFFYSSVGVIVSLPFMLVSPRLPHMMVPWLLAIVCGLILVAHNLLIFASTKHLEASISGAVSKVRLIWVLILGAVFLHEPFTWWRILGTFLAVAAGILIIQHFKRPKSIQGVLLVVASTLFYAAMIMVYKYLFKYFNTVSLTFFVTFLPATILNFLLMPRAAQRTRKMFMQTGKLVIVACGLGALANLALNGGLATGSATAVLVIVEAFLVVTLVGEHVVLKEKEKLWVKLAAVVLAVGGATLMHI